MHVLKIKGMHMRIRILDFSNHPGLPVSVPHIFIFSKKESHTPHGQSMANWTCLWNEAMQPTNVVINKSRVH